VPGPKQANVTAWYQPPAFVVGSDDMKQWFKKRTFFLTGDLPAAAYSIQCGVNTILNNTSPSAGGGPVITRFNF